MDSQTPILVSNISKRYGDFTAVDNISFSVPKGTIFGLLGPNGAGKTSTIRMIMNITVPDSGSISILGKPSTGAAAGVIGYLPEERGLYRKMKVLDHLAFLGEIRGLDARTAKERAGKWLETLELSKWSSKKVEELSKGMQQKIQLAACVIHEPEILIMDEPFSGLDPVNSRVFKELFAEFKRSGKTLILSTHVMEQAEKLCDAIVLINRSRMVLEGSMDEIKRRYSGNRLLLRGSGDAAALGRVAGVQSVTQADGHLAVELSPDVAVPAFIRDASDSFQIQSVMPHEASLDEIFVTVVGNDVATVEAAGVGQ